METLEIRQVVVKARMEWLLHREQELVERMNLEDLRLFQVRCEISDMAAELAGLERN